MNNESILCKPDLWYYLFTFNDFKFIKPILPSEPIKEKHILDIGCSDGKILSILKNLWGDDNKYTGVDLSSLLIDKAVKKYPDIFFFLGDIVNLPISSNSIDIIICSFVLHHLPLVLKLKAIDEIKRVLKPGGILLYVDFGVPDTLFTRIVMNVMKHFPPSIYEYINTQMNGFISLNFINKEPKFKIRKQIKKTRINGRVDCILFEKLS